VKLLAITTACSQLLVELGSTNSYREIGVRAREDNGFRPTANRTIMVRGDPIEDGEVRTVSIAVGVLTGTGKIPTVAGFTGVVRSRLS